MSKSSNGSLVGQLIKGLATVVIAVFVAKKGHSKWKEKQNKNS
ncbi:hypothetical protein [Aureivirga sp. CE67]|nr:hypothetical protein [Aureivirga sp. CE67]